MMKTTLEALNFHVTILRDVTRNRFFATLDAFKQRIEPGDEVFMFFAGHEIGFQGTNLLLPSDIPAVSPRSEELIRRTSIAETDLIAALQERSPGLVILVLDACRNNPLEAVAAERARIAGRVIGRNVNMTTRGLSRESQATGVLSIYSAGLSQRALDGLGPGDADPNSVFTRIFAKELLQPDAELHRVILDAKAKVARLAATVIDDQTGFPAQQNPAYYDGTDGTLIYLNGKPDGSRTADPIAADFAIAQRIGTAAGWDFFLSKYGGRTGSFYVGVARTMKQKLAALPLPAAEPTKPETPPKAQPAAVLKPVAPPQSADWHSAVIDCPAGVLASVGDAGVAAAARRCLKPGDHFKDCTDCPEMAVVPPGKFMMGSSRVTEYPPHLVTIAASFAVGTFEVTWDEWDACAKEGACGAKIDEDGWGKGRRPVVRITWDDAHRFTDWLSRKSGHRYRLLSEAEWEYAARAGTTTRFTTGQTITPNQANFGHREMYDPSSKNRMKTLPVGSFQPNAFGLYDVQGNVLEWTQDCSNVGYADAPTDGSARTSGFCKARILRGGSWHQTADDVRLARRGEWEVADVGSPEIGFRVARDLTP